MRKREREREREREIERERDLIYIVCISKLDRLKTMVIYTKY